MKATIKCNDLHVVIERHISLRDGPAFEFKATDYEKTFDVEQLAIGVMDLIELVIDRGLKIQAKAMPKFDDDDFGKPLTPSDIAKGNGEFPDVPQ